MRCWGTFSGCSSQVAARPTTQTYAACRGALAALSRRAEDVLPDDVNYAEFNSVTIRKGSVAAFLTNASVWANPETDAGERALAEREIMATLPALQALGLFEVLEVHNEGLRALVESSEV